MLITFHSADDWSRQGLDSLKQNQIMRWCLDKAWFLWHVVAVLGECESCHQITMENYILSLMSLPVVVVVVPLCRDYLPGDYTFFASWKLQPNMTR